MVERDLAKVDVAGSIPVFRSYIIKSSTGFSCCDAICGNGSMVERDLAKVDVAGSIPVFRSTTKRFGFFLNRFFIYSLYQTVKTAVSRIKMKRALTRCIL